MVLPSSGVHGFHEQATLCWQDVVYNTSRKENVDVHQLLSFM